MVETEQGWKSYQAKQSSHDDGGQREQDVGHPGGEAVLLGDGGVEVAKNHRHLKAQEGKSLSSNLVLDHLWSMIDQRFKALRALGSGPIY